MQPPYDANAFESGMYCTEAAFDMYMNVQVLYLYGSCAKGNFNEDSDIDITIVVKEVCGWEIYSLFYYSIDFYD